MRRLLLAMRCARRGVRRSAHRRPRRRRTFRVGITDDAWLEFGSGDIADRAASAAVARCRDLACDARLARDPAEPGDLRVDAHRRAPRTRFARAGIQPVVAIWGTPAWANGGGGPNVAPRSGAAFASFARAAAQQYPWVKRWVVWNEPNQRRWLDPPSPTAYVTKLLNPAAAAIKSVIPGAAIAGGATAPRGSRGGTSPVEFIRAMGRAGREARRLRAPSASALTGRDALDRGLCALLDDHDGDAGAAARRDAQGVRRSHAHLADRGRLPDEPAGPHPRRHLGAAGALGRRGAVPRLCGEPRRPPDPVPRARRAAGLGLAERPGDDDRTGQAGAHRVHLAVRPGRAERCRDQGVGSGAYRQRRTPVRRPAKGRGGLAVLRHGCDERSRALHARPSEATSVRGSASTIPRRARRARRSSSAEPVGLRGRP